jgi:putative oxidoreductase
MAQSSLVNRWSSLAPYFLSALRIAAAFMFTLAGSSKLFAFPAGKVAAFPTQMWFGGVLEFVGGLVLLLGICTRPVAFVLSGEMAVAYFQFHLTTSFWPTMNGGVAAALYCFVFLYLSAAGGGPLSLDARRRR